MKKTFLLTFMLSFALPGLPANIIEESLFHLNSPDNNYEYTFYQKEFGKDKRQMYYSLTYKGKTVIEESELGVLINNQLFESALAVPNDTGEIWGENLFLIGSESQTYNDSWKPVYGERNIVKNHYNELILKFQKGKFQNEQDDGYDKRQFYFMNIVIRAYNEGVAFRYFFPEALNGLFLHIIGEQTQFVIPEGSVAFHEKWAQGPYSLLPLENWEDESERPLTLKLKNGLSVALLEAQMIDYARMKYKLDGINSLRASLYSPVDIITPYATPWRVIMASEKPAELIENNDIVLNLNTENQIKDTSWIKPGKVIRVIKLTQEDAFKCVDFASERGLQYIHIDSGWYGPEVQMSSDATTVAENRDFDIPALTAYAGSKGIGLFVYVNQRALVQQLDEILPLYKKWGIKGIKFGFVHVGNQHWSTWLHNAVKKCAEYQMMVDIHDEYRPTGFSRTYPNLLTQEGIRGNEEMPDATHNTILPFTRYLVGAGDYTICYYSNRIKTTHAHQLALAVVTYSPLQFLYWYDQPSAYQGEPEIEFFDNVKSVWDDTKVLAGEPGEFITTVRRSGDEWFLGTITNNDARQISTSLSFLEKEKKYIANIYTDDDSIETRTKVRVSRVIVNSNSILNFQLKPSGGCAVHFVPASKNDLKKIKTLKRNQIL